MRLNVMVEPQEGLTYQQILAVARRAEQLGFEGVYRSDHYSSVTDRDGLVSTDAWATLAGLARETGELRLGTLVSPATFRPPGNLAKVVATVAEMAGARADGGARVDLGLGTTPRLAARFADELGGVFFSPEECAEQRRALNGACDAVGRDPRTVTYSLMTGLLVSASEAELAQRARRLQPVLDHAGATDDFLEALSGTWVVGTPSRRSRTSGRSPAPASNA